MSTETAEIIRLEPARKVPRLNRFDSPWLNPRFITGVIMIGLVVLAGLLGPLFWDTRLALVGSSPLNLPPAWIQRDNRPAENAEIAPTVAPTRDTSNAFGSSGLSGSGLANSLMLTPVPTSRPANDGFGASGLGGSGLANSLMATPVATRETGDGSIYASSEEKPSGDPAHPLGTDNSGRDMLAVLLVGAPASLRVGVIAASVGMIVGIILGFAAGFLGGWVDAVIRTISDVAFTIPSLAVLLVISAYMRRVDLDTMALLLSLFSWPVPTRLIRAQVLSLRERGYVRMAQLSGLSTLEIMFKEMMPNLLPYLAASLAGNISGAILAATSLEALGLGPTRYPTLGTTIFNALRATAILRDMWWWWGLPVLVLIFIFTGLFQLATGLDEIANPRLRGVKGQ
jgi:peptide/nickel transport system permease protein